ncbi:DUF3592 domain-containing protein [Nocardioides jensenii]|uniref:DUF3592 domain-containing protein n=1 Tax=Nocardioides jensenii TaxID=1843 RepID=UPI00082C30B1|nr:DUF3592 domain-containing protein [Nocardioides jensenii]
MSLGPLLRSAPARWLAIGLVLLVTGTIAMVRTPGTDATTSGTVVAHGMRLDGSECYLTAAYTVDDERRQVSSSRDQRWCGYRHDDPVEVHYQSTEPEVATLTPRTPWLFCLFGFGLLAVTVAGLCTRRGRRPAAQAKTGPTSAAPRRGAGREEGLPVAAWALAWSCLAAQVIHITEVGFRQDETGAAPSMLLGALLVGWGASGVLVGKLVRSLLAWALFVVFVLVDGAAASTGSTDFSEVLNFAASLAQLGSLWWFTSTDFVARQRAKHVVFRPRLGPLIAVAALVGLLGGLTAPAEAPVHMQVNV